MKRIIVRGPALTQSGYGEHTRFLLRSLRKYEDKYDIYVLPVNWGQTGWIHEDNEERRWIDEVIVKTQKEMRKPNPKFDISVQVTIPNEWERMAPINIGVTAGIETTKVAPIWIQKTNMMDKVITISDHAKQVFLMSKYEGVNQETNEQVLLQCETPIDIVHYPVKNIEPSGVDLELDYDFNYLMVAQWGPRKNMHNAVKWWIEENFDEEVGLVLKTSTKNNSIMDREHLKKELKAFISRFKNVDMKCKIYLLHGDLTEQEMQSLYVHPKIKAMVSLTHGEGFGLPLFDAACHAMPIVAPGWSGHCDYLYVPGTKPGKKKAMFADVNYDLAPIGKDAVWDGVLQKDSMWCYPHEGSYKIRLRQVRKGYDKWKDKALKLQEWILENFEAESQHDQFANAIYPVDDIIADEEINKMFDDLFKGTEE